MPELDALGRQLKDCDVFTYAYLPSFRVALTAAVVMLVPMPNRWSVSLLQRAFQKVRLPVGGFVMAQVVGKTDGRERCLTAQIVYDKHLDSWINGLVVAMAARLIADCNGVRAGVNFLAEAVDATIFVSALRKAGVEQTEVLTP
jgi:hypothetical protein